MSHTAAAYVTIVMPALNEARHIESAISSIRPVGAPFDYEILVLDGGSTDATGAIVRHLAKSDPRIKLVQNPKRTQAAAMNLAAKTADPRAKVLVRADCHAHYPPGFVEMCLRAMEDADCASVVVPMLTVGATCMQRAIAAAQNSRLGNGGSAHRIAGSSGFVEHGHHAAFDRAAFVAVGGYDEDMPANEDAELDRRLTEAGHKIWLCGLATIHYFPRADLRSLARQYYAYGRGRATTALRHKMRPRLRQLLPVAAFVGCSLSLLLSLFDGRFLLVALAYAAVCLGWGVALAIYEQALCPIMSGVAAMTMHMAWAIGFLGRLAAAKLEDVQRSAGASGICKSRKSPS